MSEVHIVRDSSLGGKLGTGLGTGLGEGITSLIENKLSSMRQHNQQRQLANTYKSLGIPEQIAYLPQEIQGLYVKDLLAAPGEQAYAQALQESLGGGQQDQSIQGALGGLQQEQMPQGAVEALQRFSPQGQAFPQVAGFGQPQVLQQQAAAPVQQQKAQQAQQPKIPVRLKPAQATKLAELRLKQQEISRKDQHEIDKETLPFYTSTIKEAHAAKDSDKRLDRMENLIKGGKLASPLWSSALETISKGVFGFGIDLKHLLNADSQEFDKISKDFVKNVKDYFGSRLTDAYLRVFLATLPTLSQTDEGKVRVIHNLRSFNKASELKKDAMSRILKANGGRRPRDLEALVEKAIAPQLDALASNFKKGLPQAESYVNEPKGILSSLLGKQLPGAGII
jgi:hypothetical protein